MCLSVSCMLVMTICFCIVGGVIQLKVDRKVTGYGQDLVLFCELENCCSDQAGWSVDYNPIFLDVRPIHSIEKAKYDATFNTTGFSLIIRRLTKDDLNKTYICSHGFEDSKPKFLGEFDAFISLIEVGGKEDHKELLPLISVGAFATLISILACYLRRRICFKRHFPYRYEDVPLHEHKCCAIPASYVPFIDDEIEPILTPRDNADNRMRATFLGVKGPDEAQLSLRPSEKHLARLADKIDIDKIEQFLLVLDVESNKLKDIKYKYQRNPWMIKFYALLEWSKSVQSKLKTPSFKMLYDALNKTDQDNHCLCHILQDDNLLLEISNRAMESKPDDCTLQELSKKVGDYALHLGLELGLETVEIIRAIENSKNIDERNFKMLKKWVESGYNTTLRGLMQALQIVDSGGMSFLAMKYNISVD